MKRGEFTMRHSKISILISLLFVFLLVACTASVKKADLIGKWTEETSTIIEGLPIKSIEFFEDGKVLIADQYEGTFELLSNGRLKVTLIDGVYEAPVKISGPKLTITQDDGDAKSYIKK